MNSPSLFIGIVGPSGAGKSSLCARLKKSGSRFEHIKLDNYFKSPKTFPKKLGFINWEKPSNLKFDRLLADLKKLKASQVVKTKTFPKRKGAKAESLTLRPRPYILVEGFMLYKNRAVRNFLDKKIYLDIPAKLMLERRKIRFGEMHVNDYDTRVAIPEFLKYGTNQKQYADHIINATKSQAEVIAEVKAFIKTFS